MVEALDTLDEFDDSEYTAYQSIKHLEIVIQVHKVFCI